VEAARLAQVRLVCLEDRWDAGLRVGEQREAVADLELLVAEEPLRERLWGCSCSPRTGVTRPAPGGHRAGDH
jgi:hypothetical protein